MATTFGKMFVGAIAIAIVIGGYTALPKGADAYNEGEYGSPPPTEQQIALADPSGEPAAAGEPESEEVAALGGDLLAPPVPDDCKLVKISLPFRGTDLGYFFVFRGYAGTADDFNRCNPDGSSDLDYGFGPSPAQDMRLGTKMPIKLGFGAEGREGHIAISDEMTYGAVHMGICSESGSELYLMEWNEDIPELMVLRRAGEGERSMADIAKADLQCAEARDRRAGRG